MKKTILLLIISATIGTSAATAQIVLPDIIGDSMVLQQNTMTPIWGWAKAGETVEVTGSWANKVFKTIADKNGKWMVKLATPQAGGPYKVIIKAGPTKVLHGILVGEVWLCSGQSNMEMPVQGWPNTPVNNSAQEIADAKYPTMRLFIAEKTVGFSPHQNVKGKWHSCTPESVKDFSAAGYFFGRELHDHLHIPVGLMDITWGGTVAEAWTSETSLKTMGDFNSDLEMVDQMALHLKALLLKDTLNNIAWKKELTENDDNMYVNASIDTSWHSMQLPTFWEKAGYPDLDGIVWFRKEINIPASWTGKGLKLDLGPVDDNDITYFNGNIIDSTMGASAWMEDRHYTIPGKEVKAGNNTIAIKVIDTGGNGGIYGKKNQLVLYPAEDTSNKINLSGEWRFKIAAVKPKSLVNIGPNQPSVLYNGMIAPVVPFAIKGVIWYQGESNVGRAKQYETLFPLLIKDWRTHWREGEFPFYFVQIAPFNYGGTDSTASAALRDAQRKTLNVTHHTGMAVTLDIGERNNIHPADKQEVGRRLSYWALNKDYKKNNIVYSGPLYKSFQVTGNTIIVSFTHTDGGLVIQNKQPGIFEIRGSDGIWKPAEAAVENNKIRISSPEVPYPVGVRFGFYDYVKGNLFNGKGLPASSFSSVH